MNQLVYATGVIMVIWLGIAALLVSLELKIKRLEKKLHEE